MLIIMESYNFSNFFVKYITFKFRSIFFLYIDGITSYLIVLNFSK